MGVDLHALEPRDTVTDNGANPSMASSTVINAGLEPAYANIKTMTLPHLTF